MPLVVSYANLPGGVTLPTSDCDSKMPSGDEGACAGALVGRHNATAGMISDANSRTGVIRRGTGDLLVNPFTLVHRDHALPPMPKRRADERQVNMGYSVT